MYYIVGIITGALLLIGALLILGFGTGHVDPDTNTIKMKLPILGTISTRNPFVFMAGVGFTLLIVCSRMGQSAAQPKDQTIAVDGTIKSSAPVTVFFVAYPRAQYQQRSSGELHTFIPSIDNVDYRAEFVVGDTLKGDQPVNVVNGHAHLDYDADSSAPVTGLSVIPHIEVNDAAAENFLKK